MPQAVKLTNRRKMPMDVPNGQGNLVHLAPGETKIVHGDLEYFRRMPRKGVTGLVVKPAGGKTRLVEDNPENDIAMCEVTNHRRIPMELATGVDRQSLHLKPGESKEAVVKIPLIKQMTGISVRRLRIGLAAKGKRPTGSKDEKPLTVEEPKTEKPTHPAAKPDGRSPEELGMPKSVDQWPERSRKFTWPDLRGIAKELGLKGRTREDLIKVIGEAVYGETAAKE